MKVSKRIKVYSIMVLSFLVLPVYYVIFKAGGIAIPMGLSRPAFGQYTSIITILGYYGIILKLKTNFWYFLVILSLILNLLLLNLDVCSYIFMSMYFISLLYELSMVLVILLNAEIIIRRNNP